jgi:predicted hydrocarbon binding protein
MQKRFAHLVDFMNANIDEATRAKIIEEMGQFCALQNKDSYEKYVGNTEGFLKDLESKFIEKASYDKENNAITLLGKKQDGCACAFSGNKQISGEFCNCSKGYMKKAFSTITGKPVNVAVTESVLRGSDRCSFMITVG